MKYTFNIIQILISLLCAFLIPANVANAQVPPVPLSSTEGLDTSIITLNQKVEDKSEQEKQKENKVEDLGNDSIHPVSHVQNAENKSSDDSISGKIESTVEQQIFIKHIIIEDCELLTEEDLQPILSKYENRNLTINEIKAAISEINNIYYDYGVLTAVAYLPPQDIVNDTVVIKVVEGKVGKLRVSGNKHTRAMYIKGAIHQREGDILYLPEIQKDILAFNRNNDIKLKARVRKGEKFGTSDITLEAEEKNPYHIGFNFDNTGSQTVGVLKEGINIQHDSLLGFRDRLTASYGRARSTNMVSTSYSVPIGTKGIRVGGAYGYGGIRISDGILEELNIEGKSFSYTAFATAPIIDTRKFSLSANLAFNAIKVTTYLDGRPFSEVLDIPATQIRSLVASINAVERDRLGQWMHSSNFHTGLNILGGKESYFKYTGNLLRINRLPGRSLLILKASTQLVEDMVPSAEKFSVGGSGSIRGYTEGVVSGDNGYLFGAEVRTPFYLLPKKIGKFPLRDNIQCVFFAETGGAFPVEYIRASQTISSVGLGLRVNLTKFLTGRVDYGFGLVNREKDQPAARLHFAIESNPF